MGCRLPLSLSEMLVAGPECGGEGGLPCSLSPQQPWEGSLRGLRGSAGRLCLPLCSWGCPKQNYTFNGSSSEINW